MKKGTFDKENDVVVASTETELPENIGEDGKEEDTGSTGEDTGSTEEGDDESGRPNRGTGTAGPKRPIGSGNKGQYSLTKPDGQDA